MSSPKSFQFNSVQGDLDTLVCDTVTISKLTVLLSDLKLC